MPDEFQPTQTNLGGAAGTPGSSFPSIEEGRFPAGTILAAAHERGVLHRDLKPANIMIDARG